MKKECQHKFEIVASKAEDNKGVLYYICQKCYYTKPVKPIQCQCGQIFDEIRIKKHIETERQLGNYKEHHKKGNLNEN